MTPSTTNKAGPYIGNGVLTNFAFTGLRAFAASDIVVTKTSAPAAGAVDSVLVLNSDYTVALNADQDNNPGGSITTTVAPAGDGTSPNSELITITRAVPETQQTSLPTGGNYNAKVVERALDKLTVLVQQVRQALSGALQQPVSDSTTIGKLPTKSARASKFLAFDSNGDPVSAAGVSSAPATSFGASLISAADAPGGLGVLGFSAYVKTLVSAASAAVLRALLLIGTKTTVASAASPDIWTGTGSLIDFTGSVNVTGFANAPQAGEERTLLCAGAPLFTNGANLLCPGGANFQSAAGDIVRVVAVTTTQFRISVQRASGQPIVAALPMNYLTGCKLSNNGVDAVNDIDIAAGACRDAANAYNITVGALTKQLDANWAPGTNAGGRYSGAAIANTTYGVWAATKADGTQDIYFYPNSGAPSAATVLAALQAETGGAAFVGVRRIGCIERESGSIVAFVQEGDEFYRNASVLDVNATNPGATAVTRTLSTPLGIAALAIINVQFIRGTGGTGGGYISPLSVSDEAPSTTGAPLLSTPQINNNAAELDGGLMRIMTNTSSQIRSRMHTSVADAVIKIATLGWVDTRGK